jgi:hypothetical protein
MRFLPKATRPLRDFRTETRIAVVTIVAALTVLLIVRMPAHGLTSLKDSTKSFFIAFALILCATQAVAQAVPTRSFMALISDGYELKAMSISGRGIFFLQKGKDAWFCTTRESLAEPYSSTIANASCSLIR